MLSAIDKLIQLLLFGLLCIGCIAMPLAAEKSTSIISEQPDERILWQLFHAGKIMELKQQIVRLQQRFPNWQPPPSLLRLMTETGRTQQTVKPGRTNKPPVSFCNTLNQQLQQAEKASKNKQIKAALAIYHRIIRTCSLEKRREALRKALSVLHHRDLIKLVQFSKPYISSQFIDNVLFVYFKKEYLNNKNLDSNKHRQSVKRLAGWVEKYNDDKLATVFGWRFYTLKEHQQAVYWFKKAYSWNRENSDAVYGLILSLEQQREYEQLLKVVSGLQHPSKKIRAIAARVYKARAWNAYNLRVIQDSQRYTDKARQLIGKADMEIIELYAWIANYKKQYKKSALLFYRLYQQQKDNKYARDYIQAQSRVNRQQLEENVKKAGGALLDEYKKFHARELYYRKQFQSAYKLAPSEFPDLVNIDTPYLGVGGGFRNKSGQAGTSRLDIFKLPSSTVSYTVNGNHKFSLSVSRVSLYSGRLNWCDTPIASFPSSQFAQSCYSKAVSQLPEQRLNNAVEVEMFYRKDGWLSPFVAVGTTPIGGKITPAPTFRFGFDKQEKFGYWGIETYSQSVRQSVLSYTGISDPYKGSINSLFNMNQNLDWGRVLETGLKGSVFYSFLDHRWNIFGEIKGAWLHGKNIADNATVSVSTGIARNINISGFDYFSIGPSFNFQHFEKNQNHFTFGHGGYFSPEQYYNISAGVNFLTDEGKLFIFRGRLTAGFQSIKEASSPWFPLIDKSIGSYPAYSDSGEALDFEIKGVWLMSDNFQLGAGTAFRKTNGYQDFSSGLFIRYTLGRRKAVFSTDIPDSLFSGFY